MYKNVQSAFFSPQLHSCISQGKLRVGHELKMKSDVLCDRFETQVFLNFTERLLTAGEWTIMFKDDNQFIIKEELESIQP